MVPAQPLVEANIVAETVAAVLLGHVDCDMLNDSSRRQPASLVGRSRGLLHRIRFWSVRRRYFLPALSSRAPRNDAHAQRIPRQRSDRRQRETERQEAAQPCGGRGLGKSRDEEYRDLSDEIKCMKKTLQYDLTDIRSEGLHRCS